MFNWQPNGIQTVSIKIAVILVSFFTAEYVVFIKMTSLEKTLYRALITSQFCQKNSTTISSNRAGSNHLVCIGALKKLCNSPEILINFIRTKGEVS